METIENIYDNHPVCCRIGTTSVRTLFSHPFSFVKFLIQIGHEPVAPNPGKTYLLRRTMLHPNVFRYMGHIRSVDGTLGLFRGVGYSVVGSVMVQEIEAGLSAGLTKALPNDPNEGRVAKFARSLATDTVVRVVAVTAAQPLYVLTLRSCAQFVGREVVYSNPLSALREIYQTEGILGFFAGLIPRLLADLFTLYLVRVVAFSFEKFLVRELTVEPRDVLKYTGLCSNMCASMVTYPLVVVGSNMAISGARLVAARPPNMVSYTSWVNCLCSLKELNQLKRGNSLFFREAI